MKKLLSDLYKRVRASEPLFAIAMSHDKLAMANFAWFAQSESFKLAFKTRDLLWPDLN